MSQSEFYESDRALSEYLLFHYGSEQETLPWRLGPAAALGYPVRCVTECLELARVPDRARALDLGCAVGRSTFELARHCVEVVGIDFSRQFIEVARRLQARGSVEYAFTEEGDIRTATVAKVPEELDRGRVWFEQGDAQSLRPDLGTFDVVLMANLVDRLYEPERCLNAAAALVNPGGQLILSTPCTWLECYTPKPHWLGGFEREGKPVRTLETLQEVLQPEFDLKRTCDIPFLIREHVRKYQWNVALGTTWIRRK